MTPSRSSRPPPRWPVPARLPEPRKIIGWVYCGRVAVAALLFLGVLRVWPQAEPLLTLSAALIVLLASAVTAASFWHTHLASREPGRNFLYGQTVFDTLLVTWIVFLTGGASSPMAPLYILVVWTAAVLLPFVGGLLIALLASVLYVAAVVGRYDGMIDAAVLLQLLLFAVVALLTGYLGDRLRQTGTALGEAEAQLDLLRLDTGEILDTINTGILTVDGAGRLVYMNPAAAELLGLVRAEWLGRAVIDALDRAAPGLGTVIDRSRRERRPIGRYETAEAGGGFVLGVSTTLVEREGAEAPAVTAIFQNITEKVRMEQLRRRAERLESLAELSASLAHEIKNPLASIRSAAEQLAQPGLDADDRGVLGHLVVRESTRVSRLLAQFLDFARVKVTDAAPVDLTAVVEHAVAVARQNPDAEGRELRVGLRAEPGSAWLSGAEDLLHRAVLNLLLNALQWAGPGGSVQLILDRVRSEILHPGHGEREVLRLRVADSGPGVEPGDAEQLFDPFFTRRAGGTGLGLALVQRAAEAHGGVVFLESTRRETSGGAVFSLCLPAAPPADASAEAGPDIEPRGAQLPAAGAMR